MDLKEEKDFVLRCEKDLPKMLMVDGVNYKLNAHGLARGFRISYGEFDGNVFSWRNKPIDLFYRIVDELPKVEEYNENALHIIGDARIYKTSIDDVIADCLTRLKKWHKGAYTELDEIVPRETQFQRELASVLNKYSKESGSNTPDYLLANYLIGCLEVFNSTINAREEWYGVKHSIMPIAVAKTEVEIKYGDYVQMDDRFETVHIWSKKLEDENAGRWKAHKITKEKYDDEKRKLWYNKVQ